MRIFVPAVAILLTMAACTADPQPTPAPSSTAGAGPKAEAVHPPGELKDCPVTLPAAQGPADATAENFFGWGASYGNGKLWVGGLGKDGVLALTPEDDGTFGNKFGWWRSVEGRLSITGKRIDAPSARPAVGNVPDGYGPSGFQSSGVTFPELGCWEVTGQLDTGTSITFITYVTRRL